MQIRESKQHLTQYKIQNAKWKIKNTKNKIKNTKYKHAKNADTRKQTAPRSSLAKESVFLLTRYLQCFFVVVFYLFFKIRSFLFFLFEVFAMSSLCRTLIYLKNANPLFLDRSQSLFYFVPQEKCDSHSQAGLTSCSIKAPPMSLNSFSHKCCFFIATNKEVVLDLKLWKPLV